MKWVILIGTAPWLAGFGVRHGWMMGPFVCRWLFNLDAGYTHIGMSHVQSVRQEDWVFGTTMIEASWLGYFTYLS